MSPVVEPAMHSKQVEGLTLIQISESWPSHPFFPVSTMYFYPISVRIFTYSSLLTRQIGVILASSHNLISILPICEQAAEIITALDLS